MSQDTGEPRPPFAPFLAALGLVAVGSCAAYAGLMPSFVGEVGLDKVLHAGMGFTLTLLLARALGGRRWLAAVLVFLPVAADEYLQRFSSARTSDWNDLLADVVGIAVAVGLTRGVSARGRRREGPEPTAATRYGG